MKKFLPSISVGVMLLAAGMPMLARAQVQCNCVKNDGSGTTDSFTASDAGSCAVYPTSAWTCTASGAAAANSGSGATDASGSTGSGATGSYDGAPAPPTNPGQNGATGSYVPTDTSAPAPGTAADSPVPATGTAGLTSTGSVVPTTGLTSSSAAGQVLGTIGGNGATGTGFIPLAGIPGLTSGATATDAGIGAFLNNLYIFLIGAGAAIAVVMIIWGGFEIATQEAIPMKQKGREHITQALFGLVLLLAPYMIFSIINPNLVNFTIGLSPLNTANGTLNTANGTALATQPTAGTPIVQPTGTINGQPYYSCQGGGSGLYANCTNAAQNCANPTGGQSSSVSSTGLGGLTGVYNGIQNVSAFQCLQSNGTVDPNGRTDSSLNFLSSYSCPSSDTMVYQCTSGAALTQ